ncbi:MAG: carboxypeptidase-like regulatory domain-containing protein [Paludibacter sp.]
MKKMLFITLVSFIALAMNVSAKETAAPEAKSTAIAETVSSNVLKGMVFDKLTNESLAGVVVTSNGQKVYTDLDGNFKIQNVCDGKCQLKISLISYEDQIIEVDTHSTNSLRIMLSQR